MADIENVAEAPEHALEAQDTEGDLHKRMVSSKSIEVRYVRPLRDNNIILTARKMNLKFAVLFLSHFHPGGSYWVRGRELRS